MTVVLKAPKWWLVVGNCDYHVERWVGARLAVGAADIRRALHVVGRRSWGRGWSQTLHLALPSSPLLFRCRLSHLLLLIRRRVPHLLVTTATLLNNLACATGHREELWGGGWKTAPHPARPSVCPLAHTRSLSSRCKRMMRDHSSSWLLCG